MPWRIPPTPPGAEETFNWAQCDRCEKWRRLPDGKEYEAENLPSEWFCEMNPNTQRNSCDKPEERMGRDETWDETHMRYISHMRL